MIIRNNENQYTCRWVRSNDGIKFLLYNEPTKMDGDIIIESGIDGEEPLMTFNTNDYQYQYIKEHGSMWSIHFTNTVLTEPTQAEIDAKLAADVRKIRDSLIAETDWTQLLDAPIDDASREEVRTYRQALRDIPQQDGFPHNIIYPEKPAIIKGISDPVDTAVSILVGGDE